MAHAKSNFVNKESWPEDGQRKENPDIVQRINGQADCNLRQGAGGMKIARNESRTCFLR